MKSMKKMILGLMVGLAVMAAQAAVTVANVSVAQTPGTKQGIVTYDVLRALHLLCTRIDGIVTAFKENCHAQQHRECHVAA